MRASCRGVPPLRQSSKNPSLRQGVALARLGKAWLGKAWLGKAWLGKAWQVACARSIRYDLARRKQIMAAPQVDLRLYALVDPERAGGHGLPELAWNVAAGGATLVQLRDKHGATRAMVEEARPIRGNLVPIRVPFPIHH